VSIRLGKRAGIVLLASVLRAGPGQAGKVQLDEGSERWVEVIAHWIILPEEERFFRSLRTVEERDRFIRAFWARRDPSPETPENEFKDEHLRRIAYANAHFSVTGKPGWKTDRGRLYIVAGPPDQVQRNPFGRTFDSRGNPASEYDSEIWTYNSLPNFKVPRAVDINLVRYFGKPDFEIVTDLDVAADANNQARNELENILAARVRLTPEELYEIRNDIELYNDPLSQGKFLDSFQAKINFEAPAPVDLTNMRELFHQVIETEISYTKLEARAESARFRTDPNRFFVPLAVELPAETLTFESHDGTNRSRVSLYGEVRSSGGGVVDVFDQSYGIELSDAQLEAWRSLPHALFAATYLPAGDYTAVLLLRDDTSRALAVLEQPLSLPDPAIDLDLSSLVLAGRIKRYEGQANGAHLEAGDLVFGDLAVTPSLQHRQRRDQPLLLLFQLYAPRAEGQQLKLEYTFWRDHLPRKRIRSEYRLDHAPLALVQTQLDLTDLEPGDYTLRVTLSDPSSLQAREETDLVLEP